MDAAIYLLLRYKYLILFPLGIVEGPVIAVIAGWLCGLGILNPFYVYIIIVSGDLIGDTAVYLLGRCSKSKSKHLEKIKKILGLNKARTTNATIFIEANPFKTIALSKIVLGIGVAGIFMAGNARIAYRKFIAICCVTSALQYIVYISVGLFFGQAYLQINHYLNYFATITILAALAVILLLVVKSQYSKLKKS